MAVAKLDLRVQVMGSQSEVVDAVIAAIDRLRAAKASVHVTALVLSESAAREVAEHWLRLHGGDMSPVSATAGTK